MKHLATILLLFTLSPFLPFTLSAAEPVIADTPDIPDSWLGEEHTTPIRSTHGYTGYSAQDSLIATNISADIHSYPFDMQRHAKALYGSQWRRQVKRALSERGERLLESRDNIVRHCDYDPRNLICRPSDCRMESYDRWASRNQKMWYVCATNVPVRGLGKGATLRMWKQDYLKPPYKHAEWRHALNIMSAKNVLVENMSFVSSGGDGIYLGVKVRGCPNTDVTIRRCVCDENNRQGISVISAVNLLIEDTVLSNTWGAPPQAGIDFEPNSDTESLVNCVMRNCRAFGNRGCGYDMYLGQLSGRTDPVSITLENCRSENNLRPGVALSFRPERHGNKLPVGGFLKLCGCTFRNDGACALSVRDKPAGVMDVSVKDCVFENCPKEGDGATVRLSTQALTLPVPTDGVSFENVRIVRANGSPWLEALYNPWVNVPVKAVGGDVTVCTSGRCEKVALDEAWRAKTFPCGTEKLNLESVAFSPTARVTPVDLKPGASAALSPIWIRFDGTAWIYADGPKEIAFEVRQLLINKRGGLATAPFVVKTADGKRVAKLPAAGAEPSVRTFRAKKAGFYSVAYDVGRNAVAFLSCNAPIGLVAGKKGFDVYHATKPLYFTHASGTDTTVFCGGSGEAADIALADPSGASVRSWTALRKWGYHRIAPDAAEGLWKLDFARPAKTAGTWEDAYVRLSGQPSVFFLSPEKYWR